jgi:uncharacterized protein (DUF1778 family)
MLSRSMYDDGPDDQQEHLDSVAARLRAARRSLAMTVYAIEHRRRTPAQVHAVLESANRAIHRNRLVRMRWAREFAVH